MIFKANPIPDGVERRKFPLIRKLVDNPLFGIVIIGVIILSVIIILVDLFAPISDKTKLELEFINEILSVFLIFELFLRWLVSRTTKSFLSNHWIDILAVLPLLRVFRLGRFVQLLRLVRIFGLGTALQRRMTVFSRLFEGRFIEYFTLGSFMLFALIFGTVGLAQFEIMHDIPEHPIKTPTDAFWKAWFTLLTGDYADYPVTIGGKIIFSLILLFGMGVFAMLTGTFSAIMIEKLKEGAMLKTTNPEDLNGHVIICGYSAKTAIVINELRVDNLFKDCEVLLISEIASIDDLRPSVLNTDKLGILKADFTQIEALKQAAIERARAAVILSESANNRSTYDIDARTILAALTIERLNPSIHTCVEIYHAEYSSHLKSAGVEDVVIQGEYSGRLLARLTMRQGILPFFNDLLSNSAGNALEFAPLPSEFTGRNYGEILSPLHIKYGWTVVGVMPHDASLIVNPLGRCLLCDDKLLIIKPV
ncbi:MAG: NAD-binding protein [Candidatus Riflebacteria bacterium]|nr:NAD-binding protein [Candidatus Riflebacteria bacterium]